MNTETRAIAEIARTKSNFQYDRSEIVGRARVAHKAKKSASRANRRANRALVRALS